MIIEIELGIIVLSILVFVLFSVPVLIQLRKTVEASERLLKKSHYGLPISPSKRRQTPRRPSTGCPAMCVRLPKERRFLVRRSAPSATR